MSDATQELLNQALQLFQSNQLPAAEKKAMTVIDNKTAQPWQAAKAYYLSAVCQYYQHQYQTALSLAKKSIEINSNDYQSIYFLGLLYASTGDSNSAEKFYRQSITLKPNYTDAWKALAYCKRYHNIKDQDIAAINQLIDQNLVSNNHDKSNLHFTLGKIYDDLKAYQQAIQHYFVANFLSGKQFNNGLYEIVADKIMNRFTNKYIKQFNRKTAYSEFSPLFVVGMPRSGTSLVEQILASHSKVYGAGEITDIASIISELPKQLKTKDIWGAYDAMNNEILDNMAVAYRKRLLGLRPGCETFIVNKTPSNFIHLGFIKTMLPNAKIIHIRRHPGDTCISCYFQSFVKSVEFSFDPVQLGYFYRKYREIMQHWQTVLPDDFIFDLSYEALVQEPKKEIAKLIEFCGLKWESACLEHQRSQRYVTTASRIQVNQPVYQSSIGRWEHYQTWLAPLLGLENEIANYQ